MDKEVPKWDVITGCDDYLNGGFQVCAGEIKVNTRRLDLNGTTLSVCGSFLFIASLAVIAHRVLRIGKQREE